MLRDLYNQRSEHLTFWRIIKHLSFRGAVFAAPPLRSHSVLTSHDASVHYLWIQDECSHEPLSWGRMIQLERHATSYGILTKGDAWGLPLISFDGVTPGLSLDALEDVFLEQGFQVAPAGYAHEQEPDTVKEDPLVLYVAGGSVALPCELKDFELRPEALPHVPALVTKLKQMGYEKLGDLPSHLDNLLGDVKGVGARSLEKFRQDLEVLGSLPLTSNNPNRSHEAVGRETLEYLKDVPITLDVFPGHGVVVDALVNQGIGSVKDLLAYESLLVALPSFFRVRGRQAEKFIRALKEREEMLRVLASGGWTKTLWLKGQGIPIPRGLESVTIEQVKLWGEDSPLYGQLIAAGYQTLSDLPSSFSELATHLSARVGVLEDLFETIRLMTQPRRDGALLDPLVRLSSSIAFNQWPVEVASRYQELLGYRVGRLMNGDSPTLQELGDHIGVTRERARQMYRKLLSKLMSSHWADTAHVYSDLVASGGLVSIDRFCSPPAMQALQEPRTAIVFGELLEQRGIEFDRTYHLLSLGSASVDDLVGNIRKFFFLRVEGLTLSDKEVVALSEEFARWRGCREVDGNTIAALAKDRVLRPAADGMWTLPTTKGRLALQVFREYAAGRCEGVSVYDEAEQLRLRAEANSPGMFETARTFVSSLLRNEEVLLWGWGAYIHQDQLRVSAQDLIPVVEWINEQFETGVPQISAAAAFSQFQELLMGLCVPNEHALYTCLRMFYESRFFLPSSPQVFPTNQQTNLTYGSMLRMHLDAYGPQEYASLTNEFLVRRGWKPFQLQQTLARTPGVIHTGPNEYGLIEHFPVGPESLEQLVRHLESKLGDDLATVSIRVLFREKKATCKQLRIPNEHVLYGLLSRHFCDRLVFKRFPHVTLPHLSAGLDQENKGQLAAFMAASGRPLLKEELIAEFVTRRGWTQSQLDNALRQDALVPLQIGPVSEHVHRSVLVWTSQKQVQLEQYVQEVLEEVGRRALPFGNIKYDLLDESRLPVLGGTVTWTEELLKSFLGDMESVLLLGTRRVIFGRCPNSAGVEDDDDFVAYILRSEFGGAEKVQLVERRLSDLGFRTGRLQVTVDDALPYYFVGDEIHLRVL